MNNFFSRKRSYNWPSPDHLEAAKQCANFLVPSGHHFIDEKIAMWKLSPNLIERILMFSLNCTQLKCYVLLKMVNKAIFQSKVTSALTSFHCKTIPLFTIEKTQTVLWNEENLIHLVKLCLCSLKRFLKVGVLPHFIIQGVNLFDGKLTFTECRRLYANVSQMMKHNLKQIWLMDIDGLDIFGTRTIPNNWRTIRLQAKPYPHVAEIMLCSLTSFFVMLVYPRYDRITPCHFITQALGTILENYNTGDKVDKRLANGMTEQLLLDLANTVSSMYIQKRKFIHYSIFASYRTSLNIDLTTCRLKMASMLYCGGNIKAAIVLLEDLER
ncbi:uncharacterized protein LOC127857168 [Dreissena polymorpha]|uniref:uncharacterized protein LOC127857168 n=1 Tax=Dreissena polymorpha TaxID=45954 RepID=UPI0022647005|nr:uncharacterized protein LOC127857168 [Dreissena polymorpha]